MSQRIEELPGNYFRALRSPVKCLLVAIGYIIFSLVCLARAQEVTPKMEATFLHQLKASIAQKNYRLFSELLDKTKEATPEEVRKIAAEDPFDTMFSGAPRTYRFGPPEHFSSGTPGLTLWKFDGPEMSRHVEDKLKVVTVLKAIFPLIPVAKVYPASSPLDVKNGKQWEELDISGGLPLVVEKGKLLIVAASWVGR